MNLLSVHNPITGVDYVWPTAKQRIVVSDQRRVSLQHFPGADGASSQYGQNAFPRNETTVTISFRVTPRYRKTTFDAMRALLNLAVDHGLPQKLTFQDDMGNFWYATGFLTAKNLDANEDRQWFADWSVSYVLEDPLAVGAVPGTNQWGQAGLKWGATGLKWGAGVTPYALTSADVTYTITNPNATAETRDMIFTFTGQWGAPIPGYITVTNTDIFDLNTGGNVQFSVADTVPTGTTYQFDLGSGGVYKNGVPTLGTLVKPIGQVGFMRFRPGMDNHLRFQVLGATPYGTLNGSVLISWRPKASLA